MKNENSICHFVRKVKQLSKIINYYIYIILVVSKKIRTFANTTNNFI